MADLGKGMKDRARRLCADETTSGMVTGPVWDGEEPAGQMPARSKYAHGGKIAMGKNAAKRLDQYARGGSVKSKGKTTINIIIGDKQATPPAPPPVAPAVIPPTTPPVDAGAAMMAAGAPPGVPQGGPPVGPMNRGGTVGFKRGGCVTEKRAFGGRVVKKPQGGQGPLSPATKRGRAGLKTGGVPDGDGDKDDGRGLSKATKTGRKGLNTGGRVGYDVGGPIAPQYGASDPRYSPGYWEMFKRMLMGDDADAAPAPVYRRAPYHDPVYDAPLPPERGGPVQAPMPHANPGPRPITPTPMSAYGNRVQGPPMPPARPARPVPLPPPRPPAAVAPSEPSWLQRFVSGQYTGPIDTARTFARGGRVGRAFGGPMNAQSSAQSSFGASSAGGMPQVNMPGMAPMMPGAPPPMPGGVPPMGGMPNMPMPQMSNPAMPAMPNGQPQGTPSQAQQFMQQLAGRNNAALAQARQRWGGGLGRMPMASMGEDPSGAAAAPGGFKRGGSVHMTAGARSGEGRLQKARMAKADRC